MKAQQQIKRADLARSFTACHRIEDAQWRKLQDLGCREGSSAAAILQALRNVRQDCPNWCELEAWERIAETIANWSEMFGSLQLFWQLRRKRETP